MAVAACGVGTKIVAVVVEEDVLNVLVEGRVAAHVPVSGGYRGRWRDRDADGYADVGFGGAAIALRGEMEVGRVRGRNGLGAVCVHLADAVDGDDGGVLSAPVEDDGLAKVDRHRISGDVAVGAGAVVGVGPRVLGSMPLVFLVAAGDCADSDEVADQNQGPAKCRYLHCVH